MFGKEWDEGCVIARFRCETSGPEGWWEVEMKSVKDGEGKCCTVVHDPFANRLMWFDDDKKQPSFEAKMAFLILVQLALCDADVVRRVHADDRNNH